MIPAYPCEGQCGTFKKLFDVVGTPGDWFIQYKAGEAFVNQKRPMTDAQLLKHLNGEYWIACRPAKKPKWCVIDIDNHHGKLTAKDLDEEVERLKVLFGICKHCRKDDYGGISFVMSSPRNGRHLYIRTDDKTPASQLYTSCRYMVGKAGRVYEVYPKPNLCFRLPFGKGQDIVDGRFDEIYHSFK